MQAQAVDFVYYTVSDFEEAVDFYRDTLGLEPDMVDDEMGWAEFAAPPTTLAIRRAEEDEPVEPGGAAVALAVDDVEGAVEELREGGTTVRMDPIETPVCDMARIADPNGNPITLHRRHDGTRGRKDPLP